MPGNEVLRNAASGSQFGSSPKLRLIARQSDAGSMHGDDGAIRHSRSLRPAVSMNLKTARSVEESFFGTTGYSVTPLRHMICPRTRDSPRH